jgi:hypothetical protein
MYELITMLPGSRKRKRNGLNLNRASVLTDRFLMAHTSFLISKIHVPTREENVSKERDLYFQWLEFPKKARD